MIAHLISLACALAMLVTLDRLVHCLIDAARRRRFRPRSYSWTELKQIYGAATEPKLPKPRLCECPRCRARRRYQQATRCELN